jgi:hypothetical protein
MLYAAIALGIKKEQTAGDLLVIEIQIKIPAGPMPARALINSRAQSRFMDQQ